MDVCGTDAGASFRALGRRWNVAGSTSITSVAYNRLGDGRQRNEAVGSDKEVSPASFANTIVIGGSRVEARPRHRLRALGRMEGCGVN